MIVKFSAIFIAVLGIGSQAMAMKDMVWFQSTPEGQEYYARNVRPRDGIPPKKSDSSERYTGMTRGVAAARRTARAAEADKKKLSEVVNSAIAQHVDEYYGLMSRREQLDAQIELQAAIKEGRLPCQWNQAELRFELVRCIDQD